MARRIILLSLFGFALVMLFVVSASAAEIGTDTVWQFQPATILVSDGSQEGNVSAAAFNSAFSLVFTFGLLSWWVQAVLRVFKK